MSRLALPNRIETPTGPCELVESLAGSVQDISQTCSGQGAAAYSSAAVILARHHIISRAFGFRDS